MSFKIEDQSVLKADLGFAFPSITTMKLRGFLPHFK